ncbi:ankyrin repeat protein [Hypoxylon sp. FL1284]|nr:ankyrin repeat protein [Hypoxylon sp. FL1284]
MADEQEHEGASVGERLIEACRRDNVDLLDEIIADYEGKPKELAKLLNGTTTVMGNHLYHEAALHGNYDIIDRLLDQDDFEIDTPNRSAGDTPLHCAIRWINGEPAAQRPFGSALVTMMLEAGSNTRVRNRNRLLPVDLVDPANPDLRELIRRHEYAELNAGDFVDQADSAAKKGDNNNNAAALADVPQDDDDDDDDAEFSGSDEEERAEWERRRKAKGR